MRRCIGVFLLVILLGAASATEPEPAAPGLAAPQWMVVDWLERQQSVRLAWHPVEGAFGYRILRRPAGWGEPEQVGTTKNLRWFDERTAPGAVYGYTIVAYAGESEGPPSEIRTITIPGGGGAPSAAGEQLPPPEWVLASTLLDTSGGSPAFRVYLVWRPTAVDGVVGYNVYRDSESGASGVFLGARPATETRFVDQPAWEPGRTWYYTVRMIGSDFRQSEPSEPRAVTLVARGEEGASRTLLTDRDAASLRESFADPDPVVRRLAVETLADAEPSPAVVSALAAALSSNDGDPSLQVEAVAGLARMALPGTIPALLHAVKAPDPRVRAAAARASGRIGGSEAVGALAGLLAGDPDAEVRIAAAEALAASGGDAAVAALAGALGDGDPGVAARARTSLTGIAGSDLGPEAAPWLEWLSRRAEPTATPDAGVEPGSSPLP